MKRKSHPARRARIITLGISASTFFGIVGTLTWSASGVEPNITENLNPDIQSPSLTPLAIPTSSATPKPTVSPPAPSNPAVTAPAVPSQSAAPSEPGSTVVYTCMSPGGRTENPTSSGTCKNAKYGYVITQI